MHTLAHAGAVSQSTLAPFPTPAARAPSAPTRMHGGQQLQAGGCVRWGPL
jgi:hypothetical protein